MALHKKNPVAYDLDYSGSCAPNSTRGPIGETFSVGIFQWVPNASGKGIKKSAVVKRIKGLSSNPEEVYTQAGKWIEQNKERQCFTKH